jgi:hypothetical protein
MHRHVCYILSSDGDDLYAEATYIAIGLLRRTYKDAQVTLLTDKATEFSIGSQAKLLFKAADQVINVAADFPSGMARSRYLKSSMRQRVRGNFTFMDADALVVRPCDEIFSPETPLAAALDRNSENPSPKTPEWIRPIYEHFGWDYPLPRYFNTGVMYWEDSAETQRLSSLWHDRWQQVFQQFGKPFDQPSFNSAIHDLKTRVKVLPQACNAMVEAHPRFVKRANVYHFFLSKPSVIARSYSLLGHLLNTYRLTGEIDWHAVDSAAARGDAWVGLTEDLEIEWARRNYRHLAATIVRRGWRSCMRRMKARLRRVA